MTQIIFVVNEDSTIDAMDNIDDEEIVNMIGSDYYPAIFRKTIHGRIEYALVDLADETFKWVDVADKKS